MAQQKSLLDSLIDFTEDLTETVLTETIAAGGAVVDNTMGRGGDGVPGSSAETAWQQQEEEEQWARWIAQQQEREEENDEGQGL